MVPEVAIGLLNWDCFLVETSVILSWVTIPFKPVYHLFANLKKEFGIWIILASSIVIHSLNILLNPLIFEDFFWTILSGMCSQKI